MGKNYYGFNNQKRTNDVYYTPGLAGKFIIGMTLAAVMISLVSVAIAAFMAPEYIGISLIAFIVAILGSIALVIDIVIFNRKQKRETSKREEPKGMDMGRMVHLALGIVVGIIIGYLIWGQK